MCFEMGARTPSAGCKRAADESEAQFIFGYLLNLRVAAALLTLLGVATASAQDQIGFRIIFPLSRTSRIAKTGVVACNRAWAIYCSRQSTHIRSMTAGRPPWGPGGCFRPRRVMLSVTANGRARLSVDSDALFRKSVTEFSPKLSCRVTTASAEIQSVLTSNSFHS
jgi:hypothetical protein